MIFALYRGAVSLFLSDLQGRFSQLGNRPETGQLYRLTSKYKIGENWRERFYRCLKVFFSQRSQQMPFVSIDFIRNGRVSNAFLLKSVYDPGV